MPEATGAAVSTQGGVRGRQGLRAAAAVHAAADRMEKRVSEQRKGGQMSWRVFILEALITVESVFKV